MSAPWPWLWRRLPAAAVGLWLGSLALLAALVLLDVANHADPRLPFWLNPGFTGDPASVLWLASFTSVGALLTFPLLIVLLVLFPDGRLPSPRWRWLLWLLAASSLVRALGEWFAAGQLPWWKAMEPADAPFPVPVDTLVYAIVTVVLGAGYAVCVLGPAALAGELLTVVDAAVQPTSASLWLRPGPRRAVL